ncbi:enterotoxin [Dyella flagellata]|uniref:Enterotoxin n=1 Tax=Dyella flagellata TaxID=1867833 RepID=A0ABQ5XDY3_9GAMM|nr:enterotoxin [Dyella flagellata]GLQ88740.1 enterotoxin [Dyella flagellata]
MYRTHYKKALAASLLCAWMGQAHANDAVILNAGAPAYAAAGGQASFGNTAIEAHWIVGDGKLSGITITDRDNGQVLKVDDLFALVLPNKQTIKAGDMRLLSAPAEQSLPLDSKASRLADRLPGKAVRAVFGDADHRFRIQWQLVQREGSPYLREVVIVTALKQDEPLTSISLLPSSIDHAEVDGVVKGSPVVAGNMYVGLENPLSDSEVRGKHVSLSMARSLPLRKGQSISYSVVVGVVREGQLRRDFATYVERERAHPYRPFLHYNSWYDIGYFTPYNEAEALDRIHAFGEELSVKRGVKLDSFLFDDGWDDRSGGWGFSKDFPHGFVPLRQAAAKYGAAPGMWLSPWGGYSKPKEERVKNGKAAGYEIVNDGLALSGPKYYQRFHDVVMKLLNEDGINQFKFDGTGNADSVFPGSRFDSDFAAAIELIKDIRADKPDTFINLTTGTWASPFWLRYADSIWRGGEDDWHAGVGTEREQWITYRDQQTYENIVIQGPLYPLNSLMLHGIIYAQMNKRLNTDPGHDFANEVRSYFGTGTQLQEMYITPSLLSSNDWDVLADAAKWSRANADVLRDSHWIGGDPGRLDVYGWAAWSPGKAIITLRNPDARPQTAVIDLQRQLELPQGATHQFSVRDVWKSGRDVPKQLDADHVSTITLAPFEVLTLELMP